MTEFNYLIELTHGSTPRSIYADKYETTNDWVIFYNRPPTGGFSEVTRIRLEFIISIERRESSQINTLPLDSELSAFGFIPGTYIIKCIDCVKSNKMGSPTGDKRSTRCLYHAQAAYFSYIRNK